MTSVISSSPRADGSRPVDDLEHARVVHVAAGDGEVAAGCGRLLLDLDDAVALDGRDAEPAGVLDLLQQDPRAGRLGAERLDVGPQVVLVEVVAEDGDDAVVADVRPGLRQRVGDAAPRPPGGRTRSRRPAPSRRRARV